jgi:hypothetical protein
VVQDESREFHWNHDSCTLHPAVLYFKKDGSLCSKSFCFVSDDLTHDVAFVWNFQLEITNFIASNLPHIDEIEYFTDGCAGQYKNRKNFYNLCNHMQDFGIKATWTFFATSHGNAHFLKLSNLRK